MDFLASASLVAAFFAGVAALFAPCCVTVLLPTYFASIFKQRSLIFLMTFVFFLGLLVVYLPIGLGVAALGQLLNTYHNLIFLLGAIFLILLGVSLIFGMRFSLPVFAHPQLKGANFGSVFVLGVFSGIATTCCAPVLAGVLALAALPGSFLLGGAYTLAYVLGIVSPLFILSLLLDKGQFIQKFFLFRKIVNYNLLGVKVRSTLASLFSGIMFLTIGIIILYLDLTNNLKTHASYQVTINVYLTKLMERVGTYTKLIPESVWAVIFFGILMGIIIIAATQLNNLRIKSKKNLKGSD